MGVRYQSGNLFQYVYRSRWFVIFWTIFILAPNSAFTAQNDLKIVSSQHLSKNRSVTTKFFPNQPPTSAEKVPDEDLIVLKWLRNPAGFTSPLLLPDLKSLPAFDIHLEVIASEERVQIRFSNSVTNAGSGTLELDGSFTQEPSTIDVKQNIYRSDGSHFERDAGVFYYDREHGHWHWEGFSAYEVWSVNPDGGLDQRLAINQKVGYCIIDVSVFDPPELDQGQIQALNRPDFRQYTNCESTRQGLSVGWTDTYRDHIPGQFVDITHLSNGIYALHTTVDPINIIRESDERNNSSHVYFLLIDQQLILIYSQDIHSGGIIFKPH